MSVFLNYSTITNAWTIVYMQATLANEGKMKGLNETIMVKNRIFDKHFCSCMVVKMLLTANYLFELDIFRILNLCVTLHQMTNLIKNVSTSNTYYALRGAIYSTIDYNYRLTPVRIRIVQFRLS